MTAEPRWTGLCEKAPQHWDLDVGSLSENLAAMRLCLSCPALQNCLDSLNRIYPGNGPSHPAHNPRSVIWAGVAYSETGHELNAEGIRVYASRRGAKILPNQISSRPA